MTDHSHSPEALPATGNIGFGRNKLKRYQFLEPFGRTAAAERFACTAMQSFTVGPGESNVFEEATIKQYVHQASLLHRVFRINLRHRQRQRGSRVVRTPVELLLKVVSPVDHGNDQVSCQQHDDQQTGE